jgi:anti-anti-sigma regulatory factor
MENYDVAENFRLVFDGAQNFRTVEAAYARLREASARHADLDIDCGAVDEADLSFIQLLLATRESARCAGRRIRLTAPAGGVLHETLRRGGFLGANGTDPAFWWRGEQA